MTFVSHLKWPCVPLMVGLANSPFFSLLTNISELCNKSANSSAQNWHTILEHHPLLVIEVPFYLSEMFKLETQEPFYSPQPSAFSMSDTVTSASSSGNYCSEFTSDGSSAVGRTFLFFSHHMTHCSAPSYWHGPDNCWVRAATCSDMGTFLIGSQCYFSFLPAATIHGNHTAQFRQQNLLLVPSLILRMLFLSTSSTVSFVTISTLSHVISPCRFLSLQTLSFIHSFP